MRLTIGQLAQQSEFGVAPGLLAGDPEAAEGFALRVVERQPDHGPGRQRLPVRLGLLVQLRRVDATWAALGGLVACGSLDKGNKGGVGIDDADTGEIAHLAGDHQSSMAVAEQRLRFIDDGIAKAVQIGCCAHALLQLQKLGKELLQGAGLRGVHGCSAKRAVPLMPASRPALSAGNSAISSRVWLPSSMRAPRRLMLACSG